MKNTEITHHIVERAIAIHRRLGPGLLESVYEIVLAHELTQRGLRIERQKAVAIQYDELLIAEAFRADLVVEGSVIVELKSVESLHPIYSKQLLTYLRLARLQAGLLLNFNVNLLKDGIERIGNGTEE